MRSGGRSGVWGGAAWVQGGGPGMHCKGEGGTPPPPFQGAQPPPSYVPLTASASLNGICNRQ